MGKEIFLDIRKSATVKINLSNHIEYASPYMLEVLGYQVTEFVTQPPRTICHPDMPEIVHDIIGSFIMEFKKGIAVLKHVNKTGDYIWAFTQYYPSYKEDGSFESFITKRKPLPTKKITGELEDMKYQISKLYEIIKGIEQHTGLKQAHAYLNGFLEHKGFETLEDYYMSFFDFNGKELEAYFEIDAKTPEKFIKKYTNIIDLF